jgi:hypothetical protein
MRPDRTTPSRGQRTGGQRGDPSGTTWLYWQLFTLSGMASHQVNRAPFGENGGTTERRPSGQSETRSFGTVCAGYFGALHSRLQTSDHLRVDNQKRGPHNQVFLRKHMEVGGAGGSFSSERQPKAKHSEVSSDTSERSSRDAAPGLFRERILFGEQVLFGEQATSPDSLRSTLRRASGAGWQAAFLSGKAAALRYRVDQHYALLRGSVGAMS